MGTKRAFRPFIGFTVHDVPSTSGDRAAAAVGSPGASVARSSWPSWSRVEVDGTVRGCASPVVFGRASKGSRLAATSGVAHPRAVSLVGCRCSIESVGSGVGRPPQGGRWASALHSELRWQRWPSGRRRRARSRAGSELALDVRHRQRGSGNTRTQLGWVNSLRASEQWSDHTIGWVPSLCLVFG